MSANAPLVPLLEQTYGKLDNLQVATLLDAVDVSAFETLIIGWQAGGPSAADHQALIVSWHYGLQAPDTSRFLMRDLADGHAMFCTATPLSPDVGGNQLSWSTPIKAPRVTVAITGLADGQTFGIFALATTIPVRNQDLNRAPLLADTATIAGGAAQLINVPPYAGPALLYVRPDATGAVRGQIINLDFSPKPIAVAGMSGAAPFVVPIVLPPGRNQLNLINDTAGIVNFAHAITPGP